MSDLPNPGSPLAVERGCTCPRIDNGYGQGAQGTWDKPEAEKLFWYTEGCPVHPFPNTWPTPVETPDLAETVKQYEERVACWKAEGAR